MFQEIKNAYLKAANRVLFFDYDGTLVPFADHPERALPDHETRETLEQISAVKKNQVVIISGRDQEFLNKIFNGMNLTLIAEHGVFIRFPGDPWKKMSSQHYHWKPVVRNILSEFNDKFPGAMIEEKETCIAWHYRNVLKVPTVGQVENIKILLGKLAKRFDTEILEGNMVIEIKDRSINKGIAANTLLKTINPDFIVALGDDLTDEYLFEALPDHAFTIKVGNGKTHAKYCCVSQEEVIRLIRYFLE